MQVAASFVLIAAGLGLIGTVVGSPVGAFCLLLGIIGLVKS